MVPPTNWEAEVVSNVTVCYLTKSVENLHRIDDTATAISAREEMPCATISGIAKYKAMIVLAPGSAPPPSGSSV